MIKGPAQLESGQHREELGSDDRNVNAVESSSTRSRNRVQRSSGGGHQAMLSEFSFYGECERANLH